MTLFDIFTSYNSLKSLTIDLENMWHQLYRANDRLNYAQGFKSLEVMPVVE